MVLGFVGLITVTMLAYRNAPPLPEQVLGATGNTIFTGDDVREGQTVFLKCGLMANGSIWGHGAYLGSDFSAEALHRLGEHQAQAVALQRFGRAYASLNPVEQAAVNGETAATLETNRYDPTSLALRFTDAEAAAYTQLSTRVCRCDPAASWSARVAGNGISVVNSYLYDTMVKRYVLQIIFPKGEGGKPDRAVIDAALAEMPTQFAALDKAYGRGDYLAGASCSSADLLLAPILAYVQFMPEAGQLMADYPNLVRAQNLIRQRASFTSTNPQ